MSKRWTVALPILAMLISDYLLLYLNPFSLTPVNFNKVYSPLALFHSTSFYVYFIFLISALIGVWLKKHQNIGFILGGSLIASLQFFIITNFGVWLADFYPQNIQSLVMDYLFALPFFKQTVLGDLFYTSLFFGSYKLVKSFAKRFKLAVI